jgi:hypothetical protein
MIQVPVTFDRANRRKDRSVSLAFTTNLEVSNADFAMMDNFTSMSGWCLFSPNELEPMDVPKSNAPTMGKSIMQRVRNVDYVAWELLTDKSVPFDPWFERRMEAYIQAVKDKLPERG